MIQPDGIVNHVFVFSCVFKGGRREEGREREVSVLGQCCLVLLWLISRRIVSREVPTGTEISMWWGKREDAGY